MFKCLLLCALVLVACKKEEPAAASSVVDSSADSVSVPNDVTPSVDVLADSGKVLEGVSMADAVSAADVPSPTE